jgi:hypothetical protein
LAKHEDIASLIMNKEGILKTLVDRLSSFHISQDLAFHFLEVVAQHNGVFTPIQQIEELLWILPSDVGGFQGAASLLLILATHRDIIKLIVQRHGMKILVGKAQLHRLGGHCDAIKLLGVIAKDKDFAIEIKKFGGNKMLLKVISWGVQCMHDMHLNLFCDFYRDNQDLDECQHVVMCHLEAFLVLLNHEEGLENISTTYGTTELFDVMRAASELFGLLLHQLYMKPLKLILP